MKRAGPDSECFFISNPYESRVILEGYLITMLRTTLCNSDGYMRWLACFTRDIHNGWHSLLCIHWLHDDTFTSASLALYKMQQYPTEWDDCSMVQNEQPPCSENQRDPKELKILKSHSTVQDFNNCMHIHIDSGGSCSETWPATTPWLTRRCWLCS